MPKLKDISIIGSGQNAPQAEEDYIATGKTFIKASNLDDIIYDENEIRACKITDEAIRKHKLKLYNKKQGLFNKRWFLYSKPLMYSHKYFKRLSS